MTTPLPEDGSEHDSRFRPSVVSVRFGRVSRHKYSMQYEKTCQETVSNHPDLIRNCIIKPSVIQPVGMNWRWRDLSALQLCDMSADERLSARLIDFGLMHRTRFCTPAPCSQALPNRGHHTVRKAELPTRRHSRAWLPESEKTSRRLLSAPPIRRSSSGGRTKPQGAHAQSHKGRQTRTRRARLSLLCPRRRHCGYPGPLLQGPTVRS